MGSWSLLFFFRELFGEVFYPRGGLLPYMGYIGMCGHTLGIDFCTRVLNSFFF